MSGLEVTVTEQRERLKDLQGEAKEQRNLVTDLRVELSVTINEMEGMAKENAGQGDPDATFLLCKARFVQQCKECFNY